MSIECVVGVDVGGTTVDAASVSRSGEVIGNLLEKTSPSGETADQIIEKLAVEINEARDAATGYSVVACGIGMPGPFDYKAGISHMDHKFAAIKNLELGRLLEQRTGLPTYFVNDAAAFGLGVSWRQLPSSSRLVALTIGTGFGASFIENGASVENDDRVPPNGEMWNRPYKDGILEDIVSGRGLELLYAMATKEVLSVKEVTELAKQGHQAATAAYNELGKVLGEALVPICASFLPEKIVVGGKIGRNLELYGTEAKRILAQISPTPDIITADEGNLAVIGAARHAFSYQASQL